MNCRLDFTELTGDLLNDEIFNRNRRIEERFKVDISITPYTDTNLLRAMFLAGTDEYAMYICRTDASYTYAIEGLLYSINDYKYIDLSKAYWDKSLSDQMTIANKQYFAIGAYNTTTMDATHVLTVNKQLLNDYGLPSPYEHVKNGTWTIDVFAEYTKTGTFDLNGDGILGEEDAWGFTCASTEVLPSFWVASGLMAVKKDENDFPKNFIGTEAFINCIQKVFDITHVANTYYMIPTVTEQMFITNRILFSDMTPFLLQRLRNLDTDFGILPYPKYTAEQDNYYTRAIGCEPFIVPKHTSEEVLDMVSVIIEAMSCESHKTVVPAYYELMLKTKLTRDVESEEIIDIIFANRVFDMGDNIWKNEIRIEAFNKMFQSKNNTVVSLNASLLEGIIESKSNDLVKAFQALDD